MQHLVVLSGAGISAESGLKTFRDGDGLWEGHSVYDVATPDAWSRDPALVLDFYNMRRRDVLAAKPNAAHLALADLESSFKVSIITQNIDDLHERGGSSRVLHLHGEILYSRSSVDAEQTYRIEGDRLDIGETCAQGSQLRPHVVWFGEQVPNMEQAIQLASEADIFLVIGTSMLVYPAAGLIDYVPDSTRIHLVDPNPPELPESANLRVVKETASKGMKVVAAELFMSLR